MKNLNLVAGQVYKMLDTAFVKLLNPTPKENNPYIYDKDGSFKCWDVEWYNFENGKIKFASVQQMRMDGFGDPTLMDGLPADKKIYLRNNPKVTGSGCDGHRYSSQEVVLTATGEVLGIFSWEEYKGSSVELRGVRYNDVPENVEEFIESKLN